jgi:hypothetical protein
MDRIPAKLQELLSYMDATRAALVACARDMNPSFAQIRPQEGVWSAAENLAHLALVENNVVNLMTRSIAEAREAGVGGDVSDASFMHTLDRWKIPDSEMKIVAPTRITPDNTKTVEESLDALAQSRERLKKVLMENSDIDLTSIKRPHPLLRELDMFQWGLFVAQHEERHRRQMERTVVNVTERAAECAPIV